MPIYMFIVMYALYVRWIPIKLMICVQHQPEGFLFKDRGCKSKLIN